MVANPIFIGYGWSQAFDFPEGFFEANDYVRAEFRYSASDLELLATVTVNDGSLIEGNRLYLTLTAEKTDSFDTRPVETSLTLVRDETEIPLGLIFTIPVVNLPTRAS